MADREAKAESSSRSNVKQASCPFADKPVDTELVLAPPMGKSSRVYDDRDISSQDPHNRESDAHEWD
jgi:hypothetical protein